MKLNHAILILTTVALVLADAALGADVPCPAPSQSERARLIQYVGKKFKLPEGMRLEIAATSVVGGGCHRRLEFKSGGSARPFQLELYLSPDGRFLSRELIDTRVDPIEEERRKEREFLSGLNAGAPASIGPKNASVTLTVFSDFQCPYCARLASLLTYDVLPLEREKVRLVFRHFPLSNHAWARRAAEATACAQEQGDKFFWVLHDYVFEKQREFTPENTIQKLRDHSNRLWGFDRTKFEACIAGRKTAAKIERDLAFGKEHGIAGTPTLFIDGRRVDDASDAVQIRSLIRQLSDQNKKTAEAHRTAASPSPTVRR